MTSITWKLIDASGQAVPGAVITARLMSTTAFTGSAEVIRSVSTRTATDGTWTLTLTPVSQIQDTGAYYLVAEDSGARRWAVTVPDSGTYTLPQVLLSPVPVATVVAALTLLSGDARYLKVGDVTTTGPAGGDLTGSYPNPTLRSGAAAPAVHAHPESDVTSLVTDLAGKATTSHTHPANPPLGSATPAALGTAAAGVAASASHEDHVHAAPPTDPAAATAGLRTLGTGGQQATAGDDTRLANARTPTGAAGGSLAGTYPNPTVAAGAVGTAEVAAAIKDPAAGTAGLRTLGTGALQATAGNDSRLSDSRTPTTHASTHATAGSDPVTPSAIGASATGHTHTANPPLGSATPAALGTAAAGAATSASREDHVHQTPPTDPVASTGGLRTLGTGAQQAAAGNDVRLTDAADTSTLTWMAS